MKVLPSYASKVYQIDSIFEDPSVSQNMRLNICFKQVLKQINNSVERRACASCLYGNNAYFRICNNFKHLNVKVRIN